MNITHSEKIKLVENMRRYGGNFLSKLADALIAADPSNTDRLLAAFPDVANKYTETTVKLSVDICAQLSDNPPWDQEIPAEKIFDIAEEVFARFDSTAIYDQIDSIACAVLRERGMGPKEENDHCFDFLAF